MSMRQIAVTRDVFQCDGCGAEKALDRLSSAASSPPPGWKIGQGFTPHSHLCVECAEVISRSFVGIERGASASVVFSQHDLYLWLLRGELGGRLLGGRA